MLELEIMIEKVQKQVAELLDGEHSGHGMEHIARVLDLALRFAETEKGNQEVVALIALLHDADDYKLFGVDSAKNLTNTRRILEECEIAADVQEQVCMAVGEIGYNKRLKGCCPTSLEAKIVSDADMCDALGASGILRTCAFGVENNRPFFDRTIIPVTDMTGEKYTSKYASTSVCHCFEKILKLKDLMLTKSGKVEAESRHKIVVDFLYHLFDEDNAPEWTAYLDDFLTKQS